MKTDRKNHDADMNETRHAQKTQTDKCRHERDKTRTEHAQTDIDRQKCILSERDRTQTEHAHRGTQTQINTP